MMYLNRQDDILICSFTSKYATIYFEILAIVSASIFSMFKFSTEFFLKYEGYEFLGLESFCFEAYKF